MKIGLVVEGGGMKCAYNAAILDAFLDHNIADIASQVGYQTQGKFSSAFQAIAKMSPREYRKIQGIAPSDSFSKTL